MVSLLLNIVCIVVLGAVLWYAFRLDKRLSQLDKNRSEMEQFVLGFTAAISRAERAVKDLKDTANESGAEVDRAAQRATGLRDELSFLIDAADKIATRLTDQTSHAQTEARGKPRPVASPAPVEEKKPEAAVKPSEQKYATMPPEPSTTQPQAEKVFPTWLKKNAAPEAPPRTVPPVVQPMPAKKPLQSEAERDLQQALEKMR